MIREDHARTVGTRLKSLAVLTVGGGLLLSAPAMARDWYVDGKYGKSTNSGSEAEPLQYFWQAQNAVEPGDTIHLKPTVTYTTLWITKSGTNAHPITITGAGYAPNLTKVSGGGTAFGVSINANYIIVSNLDITAPGPYSALHVPQYFHNDTVTHNVLHDAGYNGVDMDGDDYMTVSYNEVYGNAHYTKLGAYGSGISMKGSFDIDKNTGVKMRIIGNISYANTNTPTCSKTWCYVTDSDGSGIILDNNRRTTSDNIAYKGGFLVANNVVYGNGGRGIHIYLSDNITIDGNTLYENNQDPYEGNYLPGEIEGNRSSNLAIYNNILYSDGGEGIDGGKYTGTHTVLNFDKCGPSGTLTLANNLSYNAQNNTAGFLSARGDVIPMTSTNDRWGNPVFKRASLNPQLADFRVRLGSPALAHALAAATMSTDYLGTPRKLPSTIGAYEDAAP